MGCCFAALFIKWHMVLLKYVVDPLQKKNSNHHRACFVKIFGRGSTRRLTLRISTLYRGSLWWHSPECAPSHIWYCLASPNVWPPPVNFLVKSANFNAVDAAAATDCGGDVWLRDMTDIEQVSKNCETIDGSLTISPGFYMNLTLEGVKTVKGNVSQERCVDFRDPHHDCLGDWDAYDVDHLKFPDLETVGGDINFANATDPLNTLSFPKLRVVNGTIYPGKHKNDFRSLEYIGGFTTQLAKKLELRLDNLKGFAQGSPNGGLINLLAPEPAIVKHFLSRPLQPVSDDIWPSVEVLLQWVQVADTVQVNWPKLEKFHIRNGMDDKPTLVLGGDDTDHVEIRNLTVDRIAGISRASGVKNLTVGHFYLPYQHPEPQSVEEMPFDSLANFVLTYYGYGDSRPVLPKNAENWNGLSVTTQQERSMGGLQLDSNTTWYWPKEMRKLHLEGNISTDFL